MTAEIDDLELEKSEKMDGWIFQLLLHPVSYNIVILSSKTEWESKQGKNDVMCLGFCESLFYILFVSFVLASSAHLQPKQQKAASP